MRARHRQVIRAARGRDHPGAEHPPAFDRSEADPAGGAVDHERLARLQAASPAQRAVGGAVGDREPSGDRIVDRVRKRHDRVDRADRLLGEAAVRQRRHDPLARRQANDARAAGIDPAGDLHARDEGQRRLLLVAASDDQGVGEIEPRGAHADAHLARAGLGNRDVLDHQAPRSAQFSTDDCAHDDLASPMPEPNRSAAIS
jgi:hypothetical protein